MVVLTITRTAAVAEVTLQRPERRNALNAELLLELIRVAAELSVDASVRAIVLTGAGDAFCAGADVLPGAFPVAAAESRGAATRRVLQQYFNPMVEAWALMPKPVVVAQNGVAAGGGVGLALCADLLLMTPQATHVLVFVPKLGLVPDVGVSYLLPRAIGPIRTARLTLLGVPLTADEALSWGLAHAVVAADHLLPRARELAAALAANPARACSATKALLGPAAAAFRAQLEREADLQGELGDGADHAEGLAAFAAKRAPRFPAV